MKAKNKPKPKRTTKQITADLRRAIASQESAGGELNEAEEALESATHGKKERDSDVLRLKRELDEAMRSGR
jgi:hypothetical protein